MRHQYHEWRLEQVAWAILALIIIAALLGLLGPGPLSESVAGEQNSDLWIDYERVARYQAPLTIRVHLRPQAPATSPARISINRGFYEAVEVRAISPEPLAQHVTTDQVIFDIGRGGAAGSTAVTFHLQPTQRGLRTVNVSLDGREQRTFRILVLP